MDIKQIRRDNLKRLIKEQGSIRAFADATGLNAAFVSQMVNGHRNVGDKTARKIEMALDLFLYSLDEQKFEIAEEPPPHQGAQNYDQLEHDNLLRHEAKEKAEQFVQRFEEVLDIELSIFDKTKLHQRMEDRYLRQLKKGQDIPGDDEEITAEVIDFAEFTSIKRG